MRGSLPGKEKSAVEKGREYEPERLFFEKVHTCPICEKEFPSITVRMSAAYPEGTDIDMRPRYKNIDIAKYRVMECPWCGYANLDKFFHKITKREILLLKDKLIVPEVIEPENTGEREYADAYPMYRSALRCSLLSGAKKSERAYIALYTAWLLRGWREAEIKKNDPEADIHIMSLGAENKVLKYALQYFTLARQEEIFPICGLEETTFDYLLAALSYGQGNYKDAMRLVTGVLRDRSLPANLRIMAEDLRDAMRK